MKRIMIVDDSLELGRLLQSVLTTMDPSLQVHVVPSAEEAMLEGSRLPLDLLIADIRLPGISGIELVRKMRSRHPDVRVIFITGLSDNNMVRVAKDQGANAFFHKPVEIPEFLSTVRDLLGGKSPEKLMVVSGSEMASEANALPVEFSELGKSLGALALALIDNRGQMVAQVGESLGSDFQKTWIPAILAVYGAGEKVAGLASKGSGGRVQAFRGENCDWLIGPYQNRIAVMKLPVGKTALRLALAFEGFLGLQIPSVEKRPSLESPASVEPPTVHLIPEKPADKQIAAEPVNPEPPLEEFAAIFDSKPAKTKSQDANAFWDQLTGGSNQSAPTSPNAISFDQAKKMGLAPEEPGGK